MKDYHVDIVICLDTTGASHPIMYELEENAKKFHDLLKENMAENDYNLKKLRVKLICFKDYEVDEVPMLESKFFTLPLENKEFESFLYSAEISGGGDIPENSLEALAFAMRSEWELDPEAINKQAIIMLSDAPGLKLQERSYCQSYPTWMPKDLSELSEWWEGRTNKDLFHNFMPRKAVLFAFVPECYPWNDMKSWNRYWPTFVRVSAGLDEVRIGDIIELIGGEF